MVSKSEDSSKLILGKNQKLFEGILPDPIFYSESKLNLARNLYCQHPTPCTDEEFVKFIYLSYKYKFDPIEGYIQCIKYKSKDGKNVPATIFLGKDALLAIVSRQKTFIGIQAGVFYRNPNIIVQQNSAGAPGESPTYSTYKSDKVAKPLLYGYAIIYRSDRCCPIYVEVAAREYHRGNDVWNTKIETMIKKVAISQCSDMAYPEEFTGVFMAEEFDMETDIDGNIIPVMPNYSVSTIPSPDIIDRINAESILPKGFEISPRMQIVNVEDDSDDSELVYVDAVLKESNVDAAESMISVDELIDKEVPAAKKAKFGF